MIVAYVLPYLLIPLFGFALAPRSMSRSARLGFAFLCGVLLLTIEATFFSIVGIRWSIVGLGLPLVAINVFALRPSSALRAPSPRKRGEGELRGFGIIASVAAIVSLVAAMVTTRSVAADYLLFWGVKAVRFADARMIDPELLRWGQFVHGVQEYPPLVPIFEAWGLLFSNGMPWLTAATLSVLPFIAAIPVIREHAGSAGTTFWTVAMANALVFSLSGGNAEPMLLAYLSIAGAALTRNDVYATRIAAIAFAGAALTKVEAIVSIGGLVAGVVLRDLIVRREGIIRRFIWLTATPAAALGLWFLYQWRYDLPVGYRSHHQFTKLYFEHLTPILRAMPQSLAAGSWWLSWFIPLGILIVAVARAPRRLIDVIPHLLTVTMLFAFFVFEYLQDPNLPILKMSWTLPRIAQPALSFLILAAAAVSTNLDTMSSSAQ